jgi:hypothetical protein
MGTSDEADNLLYPKIAALDAFAEGDATSTAEL